ncbi:MAG: hypothetical protein ACRDGE_06640 [Candidatus Limnocylindria bacterium]
MAFDRKMLLDPPFAADPPVKLNINAKILGLILAILAGISALFGIFGAFALLGLSALAAAVGAFLFVALIGVIIGVIGTVITAWGGYQMYQEKREGKTLVIYGLVLNVVGGLVAALGGSGDFVGWLIGALIAFVVYYLVIISRFPGEPALVTSGPGAAGGSGPSAP